MTEPMNLADQRARRRLALLYVGALIATVLVSIGHGMSESWASKEWVSANSLSALLVGPPLIFAAYLLVNRGFRRCQAATHVDDDETKRLAIAEGLALPGRATKAYLGAWAVGQPAGFLISLVFVTPNTGEAVSYVTDFIGLIPVAGFPIYAIVESQMRPVLRTLFAQSGGVHSADEVFFGRFGIPLRVGLAMGSLIIAAVTFLGARQICNVFGADLGGDDSASFLLLQLPVLVLMTAMVGASVTVSLRGSIEEVTKAVRAAADGNLSRRAAVTTTDELGALMLDVHRMLANQAGLISATAEVAREVTLSASAVADGSDQSAKGVAEIAHAMQDVVSGAQVQFEQIDVARLAAGALNAAIEQAAEATAKANAISDGARARADDGSASAIEARAAMEQMQQTITEATEAVDRLGGDTADIGTIVDSIVMIADQTNLLALNAAIEAARAGEAGRGFAVVAEEVRQLASESNEAAAKISSLIKNIKGTVSDTVAAVRDGNSEVLRGVTVVDAAGAKFSDIAGALQTIGTHVGEIGTRTEEVAAATNAVSEAVEEILTVTESVAALAEETSANTEEASASSEEITSSADTLRSMAQELEAQIAVFKV